MPLVFDGVQTYACPRQHLRENPEYWHRAFLYFGFYKAGFLPQAGAVMDQANKAMEVFRVLDAANAEADESLMEARQKGQPQETRKKGRPGA